MLVVLLDDEETFSELDGCQVVEVADDYLDDNDIYEGDGRVVCEFSAEAPFVELDDELDEDAYFAVVLADGEKMSRLDGCQVVEVADGYAGDDPVADGRVLAEL